MPRSGSWFASISYCQALLPFTIRHSSVLVV